MVENYNYFRVPRRDKKLKRINLMYIMQDSFRLKFQGFELVFLSYNEFDSRYSSISLMYRYTAIYISVILLGGDGR